MPDSPAPQRRLVPLKQAADYVAVTERTILRRIADGTLTRYRLGATVRVDLNELDRVMTSAGGEV